MIVTTICCGSNPTSQAVETGNIISIEIRDFLGVKDNLAVDEQPSSLSIAHEYNLLNQGWRSSKISDFEDEEGKYPSNAQIDYTGNYTDPIPPTSPDTITGPLAVDLPNFAAEGEEYEKNQNGCRAYNGFYCYFSFRMRTVP